MARSNGNGLLLDAQSPGKDGSNYDSGLMSPTNDQPIGKFTVTKYQLAQVAEACQSREFAEEVEVLEKAGGDQWLEQGVCTN